MKPISLIIRDTQKAIVEAINGSQLPPSILEQIISQIHAQISQAAAEEIKKAEEEYAAAQIKKVTQLNAQPKEEEHKNAESN